MLSSDSDGDATEIDSDHQECFPAYQLNANRAKMAEKIARSIIGRLRRLLIENCKVNDPKGNQNFSKHGPNICFALGFIPCFMPSLRDLLIQETLTIFQIRMELYQDYSYVSELLLASTLLNWSPGLQTANAGLAAQGGRTQQAAKPYHAEPFIRGAGRPQHG